MKPHRAWIGAAIGCALAVAVSGMAAQSGPTPGLTTYYLSTAGDDRHDGRSPQAAMRSLSAITKLLAPGVEVLLRRGDTWDEPRLELDLSGRRGSAEFPMRIAAYGDRGAPNPVIRIADHQGALFLLRDTQHLKVEDLDLRGGRGWRAARISGASRAVQFDRVSVSRATGEEAGSNLYEDGFGEGEGGDPCAGDPSVYYFSSSDGNDSNSGQTPGCPKKSLNLIADSDGNPANGAQPLLQPGVTILLKRGDAWYNSDVAAGSPLGRDLTLRVAGTFAGTGNPAPMKIGAYGIGARPIVADMYRYPHGTWTQTGSIFTHPQEVPSNPFDQVWRLYVDGVPAPKVPSLTDLQQSTLDPVYCIANHFGSLTIFLRSTSFGPGSVVETIQHTDDAHGGYFVALTKVANLTIEELEFRGGYVKGPVLAFGAPTKNLTIQNCTLRQFMHYGIGIGLEDPNIAGAIVNENPRVIGCEIDKTWSPAMNTEALHYVNGPPPSPGTGGTSAPTQCDFPTDDPPGGPPPAATGLANGANGAPPGGDGITVTSIQGGLIRGNTIRNAGHSGIGNEIRNANHYGTLDCVIENNVVSRGSSSYCRGFAWAGPGSLCNGNVIRNNYFHDLTNGSHFGGQRNSLESNIFDLVTLTTATTPILQPYHVGPLLPESSDVGTWVMKDCDITRNTFSRAPVMLHYQRYPNPDASIVQNNRVEENLFVDWDDQHEGSGQPGGWYAILMSQGFTPHFSLINNSFWTADHQGVLFLNARTDGSPAAILELPDLATLLPSWTGNQFTFPPVFIECTDALGSPVAPNGVVATDVYVEVRHATFSQIKRNGLLYTRPAGGVMSENGTYEVYASGSDVATRVFTIHR